MNVRMKWRYLLAVTEQGSWVYYVKKLWALGEKEWDKSRLWTDIRFTMQRDT